MLINLDQKSTSEIAYNTLLLFYVKNSAITLSNDLIAW